MGSGEEPVPALSAKLRYKEEQSDKAGQAFEPASEAHGAKASRAEAHVAELPPEVSGLRDTKDRTDASKHVQQPSIMLNNAPRRRPQLGPQHQAEIPELEHRAPERPT